MDRAKRYLGDGVFAEFDGFALVLTTENGIEITNRIELDPETLVALVVFVDALEKALAEQKRGTT